MCHIVLGFDSNYAMPSGVAMYSVCKNTNRKIHFHIIEESVGNNIKQQFKDMVESFGNDITFYQISDEKFKGLPENAHISKSTYNRFLIPELLSEDINKCLYIDGDLLAVRGLEDLLSIDLDENIAVAAAIDARCSSVIEHNAIDLPLTKPYYNAGVMLYNLNYWRKHHVAEQCLNYIERTHCP